MLRETEGRYSGQEFGLRNFDGKFRCSQEWVEPNGDEWYIVQVWDAKEGRWIDFSRASLSEMRREVVKLEVKG